MKAIALICLLCLSTLFSFGQALTSKIFIVKNGAQTLGPTQFYTTLDPNQVISVKNNGYVQIETDADSLGVFKGNNYSDTESQLFAKKPEPVFIQLEKGKSYYFKIGPIMSSQHLDIEEMTERSFQLYVGLNELSGHLKKYTLSNSKVSLMNSK
ncbi:hypothetical protein [Spirosoma radiotolerans]|uniref:DUF2846 domain-containing protein n=1 Tax=Spirosoma radiotolerans TaxID=1379870 RepID=A0A0E3ZY61_9BACT|nr:hypothetical protein [Spirosoma radiotolerans]AKD56788.1 hypothetical protein SD10_19660 [Spirosoma radiotolerans]